MMNFNFGIFTKVNANTISGQSQLKHVTPFQLTKQIFRTEGVLGFYRGLGPTMAREMPGYFFFFGGYEGAREFLRQ